MLTALSANQNRNILYYAPGTAHKHSALPRRSEPKQQQHARTACPSVRHCSAPPRGDARRHRPHCVRMPPSGGTVRGWTKRSSLGILAVLAAGYLTFVFRNDIE